MIRLLDRIWLELGPFGCSAVPLLFCLYAGGASSSALCAEGAGVLGCAALSTVLAELSPAAARRAARLLCWIAAGLLASLALTFREQRPTLVLGIPPDRIVAVEGVLLRDARTVAAGRSRAELRLTGAHQHDNASASAAGRLTVLLDGATPRMGARVSLRGRLVAAEVRGAGASDARGVKQRAGAAASASGFEFVASSVAPQSPRWSFALFELRSALLDEIELKIDRIGGSAAGLFKALFLGVSDDLSEAESYYFRRAGAIHILALSGMHLTILAGIVTLSAAPIIGKRWSVAVASAISVAYLFLTGFPVSLVRAVIMYLLFGAAVAVERRVAGLQLLAASFVAIVMLDRFAASSLSFQLSFAALAGMLCFGRRASAPFVPYVPRGIATSLGASIGATIATTPIVAARFALLYPVGILSGLVLTPLVTAFMWGGLLYLLVPSGPVSQLLASALRVANAVVADVAELCARAPVVRTNDGCTVAVVAIIMLYLSNGARRRWIELRLSESDRRASRGRGTRAEQAVRSELPDLAQCSGTDPFDRRTGRR